jgi:hypothetical protein
MSDNRTGIQDEEGRYEDWLEITNYGQIPVSLDGIALSEEYFHPKGDWRFPEGLSLDPGKSLVVFCDNDKKQGPLHAGFRLDREGDQVILLRADERRMILDEISFGALPPDVSFGIEEGTGDRAILAVPTPGGPNSGTTGIFVRGDANSDGEVDLSDLIFTLSYLYLGGQAPACLKAADCDDTDLVDLSDVIYGLSYLYLSGPPIPEPHPNCGIDPTPDDGVSCLAYPPGCGSR